MSTLIDSVSARVEVASITESLPLYQKLAGVDDARIVDFPGLRLAVAGPFLLFEGDPAVLEKVRRAATLHVNDMDGAVEAFVTTGGAVIVGPTASAGGFRTIVEDRDGNTFECFHRPVE
jgi:predicted enzyme related to lactoylglutathione lyase